MFYIFVIFIQNVDAGNGTNVNKKYFISVVLVTTGYLSCFFSMVQYIMGSSSGTTMNISIACFGGRHASIVTATKNKSDTVLSLNNQIYSFITSFV